MMINDVHFCSSIKIRSRSPARSSTVARNLMKGCDDVALTEFVAVKDARVRQCICARLKRTESFIKNTLIF